MLFFAVFFATLAFLSIYLLPAAIALRRGHPQRYAITGLNVLLGWCFIGWIAAFVWSLTEVRKPQ